jgi:hypothetical protein
MSLERRCQRNMCSYFLHLGLGWEACKNGAA